MRKFDETSKKAQSGLCSALFLIGVTFLVPRQLAPGSFTKAIKPFVETIAKSLNQFVGGSSDDLSAF